MEKKKKETDLKGLKSTRCFFNSSISIFEHVKKICLASQKFQILAVGGKKSKKMKKWNKFSLFVRRPSTHLKHRSYFTSLITFRQRIMGSERAERITLQHKEKLQLQVKGTS